MFGKVVLNTFPHYRVPILHIVPICGGLKGKGGKMTFNPIQIFVGRIRLGQTWLIDKEETTNHLLCINSCLSNTVKSPPETENRDEVIETLGEKNEDGWMNRHFACLLLTPKPNKKIKAFCHQSQTYTTYMCFPFLNVKMFRNWIRRSQL